MSYVGIPSKFKSYAIKTIINVTYEGTYRGNIYHRLDNILLVGRIR